MKIAIHGRSFKDEALPYIKDMFLYLQEKQVDLQIFASFYHFLDKKDIKVKPTSLYSSRSELSDVDYIFSIGGDGTLLETITYVGEKQIPILGINTGRLGFLATISVHEIRTAIDELYLGTCRFDERSLIKLISSEELFGGVNIGLNEFTILKRDSSSMIVVHTYINEEYLNSYWADGLIVSTPTGSTGYSLSCGGPLVLPHNSNFIISPVSPHNLNVRPMVVPDSSVISFQIEGRSKNFLVSLDSRSKSVPATIKLAVKKEEFKAILVESSNYSYFKTLREKLNWGLDLRN